MQTKIDIAGLVNEYRKLSNLSSHIEGFGCIHHGAQLTFATMAMEFDDLYAAAKAEWGEITGMDWDRDCPRESTEHDMIIAGDYDYDNEREQYRCQRTPGREYEYDLACMILDGE